MNRFKASKFRHTEARLSRREVSVAGRYPLSRNGGVGVAGPGCRRLEAGPAPQ